MPHTTKSQKLRGEALLLALRATTTHIKWVVGGVLHTIEPSMALAIARAGVYEGKFSGGRVKQIREIDTRPQPQVDTSFWDGRATLRWARPVSKKTVDLWDLIFRNAAAAKSGQTV